MKLLGSCAALALGLAIASRAPACAEAWGLFAVLALLTLLFGYGYSLRGWPHVCLALLGVALFFHASLPSERRFRAMPWMRGRIQREAPSTASALRGDLSRRVALGIEHDRETTALNRAMLLGERAGMPRATKRRFVESGTMHVFAISGLHVMAVANVLMVIMLLMFVPLRWAGVATLPIIWGYVYMIGMPPSAVRAATMASFYFSAPLCYRRPNGLHAWSLTFLIVHVLAPRQIANVGSLLSFTVMLALILTNRHLVPLFTRRWVRFLCIALAAWSASVPISAFVFGRFTPGGLLANLVLMSTASCSVMTGAVALLLSFVSETLAAHLNNLSALLIHAMVIVADIVSRMPGANVEGCFWGFWECAGWYLAVFLTAWLVRSVMRRRTWL